MSDWASIGTADRAGGSAGAPGRSFPAAVGRGFGAIVESTGVPAASLVVEQAIYNDAGGVQWAAGTAAAATPVP